MEALQDIKHFNYLIVIFDEIFLSNAPPCRNVLDRDVAAKLGCVPPYQICSIRELEMMAAVGRPIAEILREKNSTKEFCEQGMDTFLIEKYPKREIYGNVKLAEVFDRFCEERLLIPRVKLTS